MLFAEDENNIIDCFQDLFCNEILLLPENKDIENVLGSIHDISKWAKWINSSGKGDVTPDFYSNDYQLMMDVMRVDDHGFKKKGHIINPTYEKEHQLEKELKQSGLLDMLPKAQLHIIADTGLPTEEDHNFKYYYDNFKRTIEHHARQINVYRNNHHGHKLIFFIFDESTAYFEKTDITAKADFTACGRPHIFPLDSRFIDVFRNIPIDYLIWFAPYKHFEKIEPQISLPKACIYKTTDLNIEEITYSYDNMFSSER